MNQYERGKHEPDFSMLERIAKVQDLPESFFYTNDDGAALLVAAFHRMYEEKQRLLLPATHDLMGVA